MANGVSERVSDGPVNPVPAGGKKKIAILGGGFASMSTAYHLTTMPNWQEKYDITIYTLGWRLGGKCAASRGPNGRIEEHGIHIFLGFYDTMFQMMDGCYKALQDMGTPAHYGTFENAVVPQNSILLKEFFNNQWLNWTVTFPVKPGMPGQGQKPSDWENIYNLIQMMINLFHNSDFAKELGISMLTGDQVEAISQRIPLTSVKKGSHEDEGILGDIKNFFENIWDDIKAVIEKIVGDVERDVESYFLQIAEGIMRKADPHTDGGVMENVVQLIGGFISWLDNKLSTLEKISTDVRRLMLLMKIGYYNLKGMIFIMKPDGNLDFDSINHLDYRDWLKQLRAPDEVIYSSPVRDIYTLVFAYYRGDTFTSAGNLEAGTALRGIMAIVFGYSGSVMYKFKGGTPDITFTPLHDLLKARGVKFNFFRKTEKIHLSADKKSIESISMLRQVKLKNETSSMLNLEYYPYAPEEVKGMRVWPHNPNYDQLDPAQAKILQEQKVNLESYWTDWNPEATDPDCHLTLKKGVHFDEVVCGISIAALKDICSELYNDAGNGNSWKNMIDNVLTTRTQAVQLWLNQTTEDLGGIPNIITDVLPDPINSWVDMTDLLQYENWPANNLPKSIAYYCGPMTDDPFEPPYGAGHPNYPLREWERVFNMTQQWLNDNSWLVYPQGNSPFNPDGFEYSYLNPVTPGMDLWTNMAHQFFRANIDPTERYVLSLTGTGKYRMKQGETGYDNLFIAGDWTKGHYNVGCAEETVITGKLCAEAIEVQIAPEMVDGVLPVDGASASMN